MTYSSFSGKKETNTNENKTNEISHNNSDCTKKLNDEDKIYQNVRRTESGNMILILNEFETNGESLREIKIAAEKSISMPILAAFNGDEPFTEDTDKNSISF